MCVFQEEPELTLNAADEAERPQVGFTTRIFPPCASLYLSAPHSPHTWEPSNVTHVGTQGQRHQTLADTLNMGRFPNLCENSSRKMCSNSLPRRSGGRGTVEPLLTVPCDPITSGNGSSGNN